MPSQKNTALICIIRRLLLLLFTSTKQQEMKNLFVIVCCVLLAACQQNSKYPQGIEHVVVIGIDGMSSQGLKEAVTPCMDSLMRHGAYSYSVRCVLPTVSSPNWNAMLCGAGPEITGVIDNSWRRDRYELPPVAMTEYLAFPNIFRIIREQKPAAETGSLYHWGGFGNLLEKECMNRYETYPGALETAQQTAAYILDKKPDFVFIQLDDVDHYGHQDGHMSPAYLKSIEEADAQVRIIVDAVKEAGIAGTTLVMVVSDHGGIFRGHGDNTYEELTTPIIFSGKGVKQNYAIRQQIYRYDVAADVAFALGLKAPQVWVGRPARAVYEGFDEPDNLWKGEVELLPPPVFLSETTGASYGGLAVDQSAEVKIKAPAGVEGVVRYTTDGSAPTRESTLYTAPFTLEKSAIVTTKLFGEGGESPKVTARYRVADSQAGNGLNYALYHQPGAKEIPSFAAMQPVATGVCYEFGLNTPGIASLKNQYKAGIGVCFTGWIQIDTDGAYTFRIESDGGYRLFVNSTLVVYNGYLGGYSGSGKVDLKKGLYPVKLEYFDDGNGGELDVHYEASGVPRQLVPADKLFRSK
jgi:hypothetical protein